MPPSNKGEEYDNIYPQIVPIETFDKVRKKVQKNKYGKRSVQVTYLSVSYTHLAGTALGLSVLILAGAAIAIRKKKA